MKKIKKILKKKRSGNLKEYFKSKILLALKIKNMAEDNTTDKAQIKEKEQQNSDYELFKKLFRYFENDKVFYSFNRKKNKNKSKIGNNEEKNEEDSNAKQNRDGERDSEDDYDGGDFREDNNDDDSRNDSKDYNWH